MIRQKLGIFAITYLAPCFQIVTTFQLNYQLGILQQDCLHDQWSLTLFCLFSSRTSLLFDLIMPFKRLISFWEKCAYVHMSDTFKFNIARFSSSLTDILTFSNTFSIFLDSFSSAKTFSSNPFTVWWLWSSLLLLEDKLNSDSDIIS